MPNICQRIVELFKCARQYAPWANFEFAVLEALASEQTSKLTVTPLATECRLGAMLDTRHCRATVIKSEACTPAVAASSVRQFMIQVWSSGGLF